MKKATVIAAWLPAAAWFYLIWQFSAQPASSSSATSNSFIYKLLTVFSPPFSEASASTQIAAVEMLSHFARKCAHVFLYFVLTLLLFAALWQMVRLLRRRCFLSAALCLACAGIDEYHQTFVAGRAGKVTDVLVDMLGAVLALGLILIFTWIKNRKRLSS